MLRLVFPILIALVVMSDLAKASVDPLTLSDGSVRTPITGRDVYTKADGIVSGPRAPQLAESDYPVLLGESRIVVWIVAQQHLYWVAFVFGAFVMVNALEVWALMVWTSKGSEVVYALARELLQLAMVPVAVSAILGALLLIFLLTLYPDFIVYLAGVFRHVFLVFGLLVPIFGAVALLYYRLWPDYGKGWKQWLHASLGIVVNAVGGTLVMIGNAWSSFMVAPAGIDERGRYLGHVWDVIHTALWNPFNLHRIAGHILCASAVFGAYAAARTLMATEEEEKAHFDRMGSVVLIFMLGALVTLPAGGYWLMREMYAFRQQMGITLFGGLLAWLGIILVGAIAFLLFGLNYYLWQRISSAGGSAFYGWMSKWIFGVLALCALVYITPHTMVMTPFELKQQGGQQHPVLGNYGVESAKSAAMNLMLLITAWSFVLWRFSHRQVWPTNSPRLFRTLAIIFLVGAANVLCLGIYGYYIPANVRVGLFIPMVATTFSAITIGLFVVIRAKERTVSPESEWGRLSARGHYALLLISFMVIWVMGLGGYRRSAVRLYWHVTDIMKDASPWSFTHTTGFAVNVIALNALLFWFGVAAVMWLGKIWCGQQKPNSSR